MNGRNTFRFDTFGDEAFWGDALKLHQAIAGAANGGVGPGVSPETALAVGLKVDAEALPADVAAGIKAGNVDLNDPATTLALLKLNAVVGVTGFFASDRRAARRWASSARSVTRPSTIRSRPASASASTAGRTAISTSARSSRWRPICRRSTQLLGVDDATVKTVLAAWGPGKFDAELALDGQGFRPDGKTAATLLPAAFGLAGVAPAHLHRLGLGHALERVRREPRDDGQGDVLRSAPEQPDEVPGRRAGEASRTCARRRT